MQPQQTINKSGIDASLKKGTRVPMGFIEVHKYGGSYEAFEVWARQYGATTGVPAKWNIEIAGKPLFKNPVGVTELNSNQLFRPNQNIYGAASAALVELVMEASGSTGTELVVSVTVRRV